MSLIQTLVDSGEIVLYHDYRAQSLKDWSSFGNDGVGTDLQWSNRGVGFPLSTSNVEVADSAELQLTEGTLIVYSADGFLNQNTANRLIFKRDGGGSDYDFHIDATTIRLYSDGVNLPKPTVVAGHKYVAINMKSTEQCEAFVDGVSIGLFALASSIVQYNAPLYIGSYGGVASPLQSVLSAALIVNRKLTAVEHAQLYSELANMKLPTKAHGIAEGVYGPELLTDGDMEAVGTAAWSVGLGVVTKETGNVLGGSQVLRSAYSGVNYPHVYQTVLEVGKTYRATGWMRGDGTYPPRVATNNAYQTLLTGSSATSWQYFDLIFTPIGDRFRVGSNATGAGYAEFDDVSVREVVEPEIRYKSSWGVHPQTNVGGGEPLSDTGAYGGSGNNGLVEDEIDGEPVKVVTCAAAGNWVIPGNSIHQPPEQQAYGTWEWWVYRHGVTQNMAFAIDATMLNGYLITLVADNIYLQKLTAGAPAILDSDLTGAFPVDNWYKIRVTRRQRDGLFVVYVNDVQMLTATDNIHSVSAMIGFDISTGDKISWADLNGDHCILKMDGVVEP